MSEGPLSRRARRAPEPMDGPVAGDPAYALAQGLVTGEIPAIGPDGAPLTRRDRRRLERLVNPMEAWTAEEEMIATGQIPVLTPERIAEQERAARLKAEQAAQEALAKSQEFNMLASGAIPVPQMSRPFAHEAEATAAASAFAPPADVANPPVLAPSEPEALPPRVLPPVPFGWQDPAAQQPSQPQSLLPGAAAQYSHEAPVVEPEPAPRHDPYDYESTERYAAGEAQATAEIALAKIAEANEAWSAQVSPPRDERERVLQELFPPGSAQAALIAGEPIAPAVVSAPESLSVEVPSANQDSQAPDPVEEIRRLAAQAISGIEKAASSPDNVPQASSESMPQQALQTPQPWAPAAESGQQATAAPAPTAHVEATPAQAQGAGDGFMPFAPVTQNPEVAAPQTAQPGPWDALPLASAPIPQVDPNQFAPLSDVPRPDLSALVAATGAQGPGAPAFNPAVGAQNAFTGSNPIVTPGGPLHGAPVATPAPFNPASTPGAAVAPWGAATTGSLDTAALRRAEAVPRPDPKSFKWLHLGVIGALMFVLGVVIYHVAFGQ